MINYLIICFYVLILILFELDLVLCVDGTDFNSAAAAKIAVQSTGMVSDAIILEAVDMTEIVSKASTLLGSYSKPGG